MNTVSVVVFEAVDTPKRGEVIWTRKIWLGLKLKLKLNSRLRISISITLAVGKWSTRICRLGLLWLAMLRSILIAFSHWRIVSFNLVAIGQLSILTEHSSLALTNFCRHASSHSSSSIETWKKKKDAERNTIQSYLQQQSWRQKINIQQINLFKL